MKATAVNRIWPSMGKGKASAACRGMVRDEKEKVFGICKGIWKGIWKGYIPGNIPCRRTPLSPTEPSVVQGREALGGVEGPCPCPGQVRRVTCRVTPHPPPEKKSQAPGKVLQSQNLCPQSPTTPPCVM